MGEEKRKEGEKMRERTLTLGKKVSLLGVGSMDLCCSLFLPLTFILSGPTYCSKMFWEGVKQTQVKCRLFLCATVGAVGAIVSPDQEVRWYSEIFCAIPTLGTFLFAGSV